MKNELTSAQRHFLKTLKELSDATAKAMVPNFQVRKALGVEDNIVFHELKESLVEKGLVKKGMGRGGRISLTKHGLKSLSNEISSRDSQSSEAMMLNFLYENGEISENDLITTFQISPDRVKAILKSLKGSSKVTADLQISDSENLVLKTRVAAETKDESIAEEATSEGNFGITFSSDEDREGRDRLLELFKSDGEGLTEIASEYYKLIRNTLRDIKGRDVKPRLVDLASALIARHGFELLSNREIREALCKKARVPSNIQTARWVPGSKRAVDLATALGFPEVFAGEVLTSKETQLFFPKRTSQKPLKEFQVKARDQMLEILKSPGSRGIVMMPTGTGKTKTAMSMIHSWFAKQVEAGEKKCICIWMAHTEELCEQAISQVEELYNSGVNVSYSLRLFRMWAKYSSDHKAIEDADEFNELVSPNSEGCYLIITNNHMINKLVADDGSRDYEWVKLLVSHAAGMLVIDEAHRACAPTYEEGIDHLSRVNPKFSVVGLTATPKRATGTPAEIESTRKLIELFENRIINPFSMELPRKHLVDSRILARPKFTEIRTEFSAPISQSFKEALEDLEEMDPNAWEGLDKELASVVESRMRREPIAQAIRKVMAGNNRRAIYFGPSVEDAHKMAWRLRTFGIEAASVDGKTPARARRRMIQDFRDGKIRVICNYDILTAGFDVPLLTDIFVARPTVSTVLYEQMIGRGLRGPEFGGTEECVIHNVVDEFRPIIMGALAYEKIQNEWESQLSAQEPKQEAGPKQSADPENKFEFEVLDHLKSRKERAGGKSQAIDERVVRSFGSANHRKVQMEKRFREEDFYASFVAAREILQSKDADPSVVYTYGMSAARIGHLAEAREAIVKLQNEGKSHMAAQIEAILNEIKNAA